MEQNKHETMRLDKFLCHCTGLTRTEAKNEIKKGRVFVNGEKIKSANIHVSTNDEITHRGKNICYEKHVYIMLNKPKGVVCATTDKINKTVIEIVKETYNNKNLFVAGRLDKDSTGFVLITNNGEFAHEILSPKKHIKKTYNVILDVKATQNMVDEFEKGIILHDGTKTKCAQLILNMQNPYSVDVVLTQGMYHQVKRMFGVLNAGVNELHRTAIGKLCLDENLKEGECRQISENELKLIF